MGASPAAAPIRDPALVTLRVQMGDRGSQREGTRSRPRDASVFLGTLQPGAWSIGPDVTRRDPGPPAGFSRDSMACHIGGDHGVD